MIHTASFSDLEAALPYFINLHGLTEIDTTDNEDDQLSLTALTKGLERAGIDISSASRHNKTLTADDHFADDVREQADESGDINEAGPVAKFVDWERYAAYVKADYTQVEIAEGAFAGTWWTRQ